MYGREKRVLLKKGVLDERLGISRRTLYHWIATNQLDRELDDEAVVLGYSRLIWLRFFSRQTMEVLFRGLDGRSG